MGYIYVITNDINNKKYVGKTEYANPCNRFKEHIKDSKKESKQHRPLQNAMKKYGVEHFHFSIIEETEDLSNREIYWIKQLDTYGKNGYNATFGGDGKKFLSYTDEEIVSYYLTEAKQIVRRVAIHFGIDRHTVKNIILRNGLILLTNDEITKIRCIENNSHICQIDPKTNEIIATYINTKEAHRALGKTTVSSNIRDVLNGKHQTAYGYKWEYLKNIS